MLDSERKLSLPCWMLKQSEICFVHLGKFGDLMIMLPAFKAVAEEMGKAPICIVSKDFASIFDGVSYVRPWVVDFHWWKGVGQARRLAMSRGFNPIVVKWWDDPELSPPAKLEKGRTITLTIHGRPRTIPRSEWDSFQASQWRYAGFTMEQMMQWPLVFDRRSPEREHELLCRHFPASGKPLLVNVTRTGTSPFPSKSLTQVMGLVMGSGLPVVNLAGVSAIRIYDLLGLYDHAAGLVTSDTATLHLAAGSNVPYIAFVNNGGSGSVPKGNCVASIRYGEIESSRGFFLSALNRIKNMAA